MRALGKQRRMAGLRVWVLLFLSTCQAAVMQAAPPDVKPASAGKPAANDATNRTVNSISAAGAKIQTRADQTSYDLRRKVVEAKGNVIITYADQTLTADYVIVNEKTGDAEAFGDVVLRRGESVWRGERLRYNMITRVGDSDTMAYQASPFRLQAAKISKGAAGTFLMENARVTTCADGLDCPHYHVRVKEVTLDPGKSIKGKHATIFLGPLPVFYFPWWYRSLEEDMGFRVRLGYSSDWGAYALTSYRYPMSEHVKGETHLDYRAKRGIGVGQDLLWMSPQHTGILSGYYVDDKEPLDDDDPADADIDNARYRIKLKHLSSLTQQDSISAQAAYLSDSDILEDFFEKEYRESSQPDNYVVYSHADSLYTLNLLARARLNDFYGQVNRLPELSLAVLRQPIGDSPLYYEGMNSVANLERVYPEGDGSEEYSTLRADSGHMVYWPERIDFLTVVPRAGVRVTYYGDTVEAREETTVENVMVTNGTVVSRVTRTNTTTRLVEQGAGVRSRGEIGLETSFKAFKAWGTGADARRHVVEPYANYTYIPFQSLEREELYQFDDIDSLAEDHMVLVGLRNKYQRKKETQPVDLADVNVYTRLFLDKQDRESSIDDLFFDARFLPSERLQIWLDGAFDINGDTSAVYNARIQYSDPEWWVIGGEFRHEQEQSSLMTADITLLPNWAWTFNVFGRYELEESQAEEQGGYIQRNLDCLSIRFRASILPGYENSQGVEVEDEWRTMLEFWIRAFPSMRVSGRHGW